MRSVGALPLAFLVALAPSGCTYGPVERSATVSQVVRLGDSYRAIAVVRFDAFRRPTGLSAFPDGGRWRYVERGAAAYLVDARERSVLRLALHAAEDDLWESFGAWIAGVEGDSIAYLRLTGCPRDGECHPSLQETAAYRLPLDGGPSEPIPSIPSRVGLPGEMAARASGERNYVRFGTLRDTVTARFEEGETAERLFVASPDGSLRSLGGWP